MCGELKDFIDALKESEQEEMCDEGLEIVSSEDDELEKLAIFIDECGDFNLNHDEINEFIGALNESEQTSIQYTKKI